MKTILDKEFAKYGKVLDGDYSSIVKYLEEHTIIPETGNIYVRNDEEFLKLKLIKDIEENVFAETKIEAGYCNGKNTKLNCLEYHACYEVNVAATDLILLLALQEDIVDGKIESTKTKAFYIKKGQAFALYPLVLHFSPIKVQEEGFKCAVLLTNGTNMDLINKSSDPLVFKQNKWLIAHPEAKQASMGAYIGITGENIEIKC